MADYAFMSTSARHRKGYPTEIFRDVSVPIAKFICAFCTLILNNPVQRFCGHRYCKTCIDEATSASDGPDFVCPACTADDADEELTDNSARQVILSESAVHYTYTTVLRFQMLYRNYWKIPCTGFRTLRCRW